MDTSFRNAYVPPIQCCLAAVTVEYGRTHKIVDPTFISTIDNIQPSVLEIDWEFSRCLIYLPLGQKLSLKGGRYEAHSVNEGTIDIDNRSGVPFTPYQLPDLHWTLTLFQTRGIVQAISMSRAT